MKGGWQGLGLGSPPTMSAPPGSMAACPVLGLATLLFLSAPQASSMVQYRQLVPVVLLEPQGRDCSHIWVESPRARSGVYAIQPEGASAPFKVLCDMRTDGGWTVIQSRDRGRQRPLDFERCWQEYKRGFGDLRGDHWLGLEHISGLTSQPGLRSELVVDLLDTDNHTLQAHYDNFHVDKEDQFYQLTLGLYSGNAGECWGGKEPLCLPPGVLLCPWALQAAGGGLLQQARVGGGGWVPGAPNFPAHICQPLCSGEDCPSPSACPSGVPDGKAASGGLRGSWPAAHATTPRRGRVPGLGPDGQPGGLWLQHAGPRP
ncbi:uncharacterized protein LOC118549407 isoform X1 [Halichoerus grypus]